MLDQRPQERCRSGAVEGPHHVEHMITRIQEESDVALLLGLDCHARHSDKGPIVPSADVIHDRLPERALQKRARFVAGGLTVEKALCRGKVTAFYREADRDD